MPKDIGQDFAVYLSGSSPTSGSEGSTGEYDLVGFSTEDSLNIDRDLIESADKGDSTGPDTDMTYVAARRTSTVEATVHKDTQYGSNAGQQLVLDNINGASANDDVWFLLTDDVAGHIQFYGKGKIENAELTLGDQEMIEMSLTLQVDGSLTIQAA
jgi:hypothetical protein